MPPGPRSPTARRGASSIAHHSRVEAAAEGQLAPRGCPSATTGSGSGGSRRPVWSARPTPCCRSSTATSPTPAASPRTSRASPSCSVAWRAWSTSPIDSTGRWRSWSGWRAHDIGRLFDVLERIPDDQLDALLTTLARMPTDDLVRSAATAVRDDTDRTAPVDGSGQPAGGVQAGRPHARSRRQTQGLSTRPLATPPRATACRESHHASNASIGGRDGLGQRPIPSSSTSSVLRPLPVMTRTTSSSRRDAARVDRPPQRGERHATGGLGQDALGPGEQADRIDRLGVGHAVDRRRPTSGRASAHTARRRASRWPASGRCVSGRSTGRTTSAPSAQACRDRAAARPPGHR